MSAHGLPARIRALSEEMFEVAVELEYFGGFSRPFQDKASEMFGACSIARQWAEEVESIIKKTEESHVAQTPVPSV